MLTLSRDALLEDLHGQGQSYTSRLDRLAGKDLTCQKSICVGQA
jgi:hypothetical protein